MATLDWDGLVFYDQQIKKHIENKLVDAGISKDELDKILDKYASKTYVSDEITKAAIGGVDLTIYAKTSDIDTKLANYVKKTDAFNGDYNNLTNKPTIPDTSNLATKVELTNYVKKTDAFSGDYNDLNNKPDITNLAKKTEVTTHTDNTSIHITSSERTLWNTVSNKSDKSHTHTKSQITDMPTKLSQFTNDSGFITSADVDTSKNHTHSNKAVLDGITSNLITKWNNKAEMSDIPSLTNYATKTYVADQIAKVSTSGTVDLTGYAKTADVDTKLANYVKKTDAFNGDYNNLTNKPTIPDTSNLATKVELNNHVGSTKHITDDERTKWNGYNDTINTMKTNFEDGVNTIYNAVVAKGVTPSDKSPSNVAKAIESLVIKEKGQLLLKCKSNYSNKLPAPKFNDDNSYNYTCEDTDNGDGTFTRNIYGAKEINQICFYQDKNKDWFKSLEYTNNIKIVSAENMFYLCINLESVNLNNIDTSECKNFESMFSNCESLTSLDLSNFNTSKVKNTLYMFNNCTSLTSLDLSNFNTSQVTGMSYMFNNCTSLTSLDLSNFDTSNVDSMSYMFNGCTNLTSLDLSNFNTENVQYFSKMFNKVPSTCTIYVDKTKFTKTEAECGFTGTFTDVSIQG